MSRLMHTIDVRDVTFVGGRGPYLYDQEDNKYLDFFTDVGTSSLGYSSPEHSQVLQMMDHEDIPFHAPNLYKFDLRDKAAELLCHRTQMDKIFFCNSGTEAVETAIKLARKYQYNRIAGQHVYSVLHGFHGRTYASLAAGDGPSYHYDGYGPMPKGFRKFIDPIDIDWASAAAVIVAPVFGNNDVIEYPDGWLKDLRDRCDKSQTLLIFDEVQTGSGRTGAYTYAQHVGVRPDILCLAKGIAMGCPVGACLARGEVADAFTPGTHFSTFGGGPLSCASVLSMWNWLHASMDQINDTGEFIRNELREYNWTQNVRGPGMLIAYDIDLDGIGYSKACLNRGLLVGAFRAGPGPVKVTPPLNIERDTVLKGIKILDQAYHDCHS